MSENLSIRPATVEDLPAMQRIRSAAFAPIFLGFREAVGATGCYRLRISGPTAGAKDVIGLFPQSPRARYL